MFKKLLLILAFSLPLFAQVENTTLRWVSKNYWGVNSTTQWTSFLFEYSDTLWLLSEDNGSSNIYKFEGSDWTKIVSGNVFDIPIYGEGSYQVNGGFDYLQKDSLIYAAMNRANYLASPGVHSQSSYTYIYNIKTRTLSQSSSGYPGLGSVLRNWFSFTQDVDEDSLIIYSVAPSYTGDTTWNRLSKPLNTGTQDWTTINITGVETRRDIDALHHSRGHVYSFEMGGYIYLFSGMQGNSSNMVGKPIDTLWVHKSTNRLGIAFNEISIYGFPDNEYYTITGHTIINDSTAFLFFDGRGATDRGLHIFHSDGTIDTFSVPTNLIQWAYLVMSDGTLLLSVNDNTAGDGADSSKIYIRDIDSNWTWMRGPVITTGDYGCPSWLQEIGGRIYVFDSTLPLIGTTTGIDAQARLEDRVFMLDGFLSILTPVNNSSYTATDVSLTYGGGLDTALFYYSEDAGTNWSLADTIYNGSYTWSNIDILGAGINGQVQLYLTDVDSIYYSNIRTISYIGLEEITILYPLSLSSSKNIGDTIHIQVETVLVDSFSLFYSVGDTTNWIPISYNLTTDGSKDTTTYIWSLPNISGAIYLLATENITSDTIDITLTEPYIIGTNHPSQPAICWSTLGGNAIEMRRYYDQSCRWVATATFVKSTMTIDDYADGYTEIMESCPYPGQYACVTGAPLRTSPVYYDNGIDIIAININDFYTQGDTILYKNRRYYLGIDSVFYCDDLINQKDSLIIADLRYYHEEYWYGDPYMVLYNVQRSKIQNDTLVTLIDLEYRNDDLFIPVMIISATIARGSLQIGVPLLESPPDVNAQSDMVLLFSQLNITKDYFRGIDPKARKKNR
jgi:hypothetical protein